MRKIPKLYRIDSQVNWRQSYKDVYSKMSFSVQKCMILWLVENASTKRQFNYYLKKLNEIESSKLRRDKFFKLESKQIGSDNFRARFQKAYKNFKYKTEH